jgi:hypothetical protein
MKEAKKKSAVITKGNPSCCLPAPIINATRESIPIAGNRSA